ncbi:hypothetical protein AURDEDRAFT_125138 [Auricularia subglabra TFB-10046 SS5]|uniref:CBM1 domain-containing protein n=1 Tax=Auricularia subglabra (strain TFB-10046 / SS5) TaxID=717982 RepID=J0D354_AURST|nr:hypothetical protein AURDEDRAFT_125138 [Auricularia subglabra TFB-10046 SS5]
MRSLSLALLTSVALAAVLPRQATQCAVCPEQIGPDANGTVYPLLGQNQQLGAPTFCLYKPTFKQCWYGGGGGIMTSSSDALCPPSTTTSDCPPHINNIPNADGTDIENSSLKLWYTH